MRARLSKAGIASDEWHHAAAIHGAELDLGLLMRTGFVRRGLNSRDVGCAWSHYALWAGLARAQHTHHRNRSMMVLEDDAILLPSFLPRASRLLRRCEELHHDLCFITWYRHMVPRPCVHPAGGQPPVVRLACDHGGMVTGTAAYFITARGAERALEAALPMRANIDVQIGASSHKLRWFAVEKEQSIAAHDFSVPSVRVTGRAERLRSR